MREVKSPAQGPLPVGGGHRARIQIEVHMKGLTSYFILKKMGDPGEQEPVMKIK